VRRGLHLLLEEAEDVVVVGEASDGREVLDLVEGRPDVLVLDAGLPTMDGVETARRIAKDHPDVGLIILTPPEEPRPAIDAMRAGARGYVLESSDPSAIVEAVRRVARGESVLDPQLELMAVGGRSALWERQERARELTARQVEVLQLLAQRLSDEQIARRLGISHATVKQHVRRILAKLGAAARADAAAHVHDQRYVLGRGPDFYGIWDQHRAGRPVETFPSSEDLRARLRLQDLITGHRKASGWRARARRRLRRRRRS
jgi:DNA-binding NarL/FixJ family response regulator